MIPWKFDKIFRKKIREIGKSMFTSGKNIVIAYKSYRIILRKYIRKILKYDKNRQYNLNPVLDVET